MRISALTPTVILIFGLSIPNSATALDLDEYKELPAFIDLMSEQHGFSNAELRRLFSQVEIQQDIIDAIEKPRETLPWYKYKELFVTEFSARRGEKYWRKHRQALTRAGNIYGVDPAIIVAIMGVETQYGRNTGNHRVADALTTLMLKYPRRSEFFENELKEYLLLTREIELNPLEILGSYAGAMGMPQFIPSSYRRYAVDFDNNNKRDILTNHDDTIGSIANFFKLHGWRTNQPVVDKVELENSHFEWLKKLGTNTKHSLKHFLDHGIFPPEVTDGDMMAALIELESEHGSVYRLVYNNFYVITRYNRSKNYAMAVYELSQMVRKRIE